MNANVLTVDPAATQTVAALHHVSVCFSGGQQETVALDEVSLQVPAGQVFCLLGPNGAGKTTAINVITGLVAPAGGQVRVGGLDPAADRRAVLAQVALVPQETALYERLSAQENLEFHGRYYGVPARSLAVRIDHALEVVGLVDRRRDRVSTYSGGMRRRLALARALLTEAKVVLLDEPTLGVDVQSRNAIWEQIRTLAATGVGVVLTTNYMDEAEELADTIQLIDRGRTVAHGTAQQLKDHLKLDMGDQLLLLRFNSADAAAAAAQQLEQREREPWQQGASVQLHLSSPEAAIEELSRLPSLLGEAVSSLDGFELHEPSLQEVFLHFTGRGLRD